MSESRTCLFRNSDGQEVVTRFQRAGRGATVVLVHGVGAQAAVWKPQIDALAAHFDVVVYDMLGHGGSSPPRAGARLSDYSDQLLALVDFLGISRCHCVGHSMGALVALEFALSHVTRVLSVTAMNAVFCRTAEQRLAVEERAAAFERQTPLDWSATLARWFGEPLPESSRVAADIMRSLLSSVDPVGYSRTYRVFATADETHRDRLTRLEAPALFLTGEQDPNSSPAMSQAMAAIAPRGHALIIPDERHMMSLTSPERINGALLEFLGGIGRGLPAIDDRVALRKALGSFVTGVTVVATRQADGQPRGFTANSFTSVSLDPPLILVCVSKSAASCAVFASARHFAVSILAEHQAEVSSLFASKAADKFERTVWRTGPEGSPVVSAAVAWLECRRDNVIDAGDHIVVIGRVIAYDYTSLNPLGYFRGAHATFGLSPDVLAASGNRTLVGAILEQAASIVLIAGGDGTYDLPSGAALGHVNDPASLAGRLQQLGIKATLHFLFAVFDNPARGYGAISIYYRGTLEELPPSDARVHLISFNSIPWQQLKDDAVRSMLRRYVRERSEDTFGIYVGDAERGTVRALAPG